jgi:hypothetical protein
MPEEHTPHSNEGKSSLDLALLVAGHEIEALVSEDGFEDSAPAEEVEMSPSAAAANGRVPFGGCPLEGLGPQGHAGAL